MGLVNVRRIKSRATDLQSESGQSQSLYFNARFDLQFDVLR